MTTFTRDQIEDTESLATACITLRDKKAAYLCVVYLHHREQGAVISAYSAHETLNAYARIYTCMGLFLSSHLERLFRFD